MQTGTIAVKNEKGYGFIKREGQERDLFFHSNECNGAFASMEVGQAVTFEVADSPKGPNAIKVSKI